MRSADDTPAQGPVGSRIGTTLGGRYRLVRMVGSGGMGEVYKAEHLAIGRAVAIKILHAHLADDGVALARFQREARTSAAAAHENVIEILDMGEADDGAPFIVMELVQGPSLADVLRTQGALPVARACDVAGQILSALTAVHAKGVVHRDLKPENVLLTTRPGRRDHVKLLDFGIATYADALAAAQAAASDLLTPLGRTMATPHYASPEQLAGSRGRDPRVDIWAVGVMLFEMLTGHLPFEAEDFIDFCGKVLGEPAPPLTAFLRTVPPGLDAVLQRALVKAPEERYQTSAEMRRALVAFGAEPIEEAPAPPDPLAQELQQLRARELRGGGPQLPLLSTGEVLLADALRGAFVGAVVDFLRERIGADMVAQLLTAVAPDLASAFEPEDWIPAEPVSDLLEAADRYAAGGDRVLVAESGRFFARRLLSDPANVEVAKSLSPEALFAMAPSLYADYFAGGSAAVTRSGRGFGCLSVAGQLAPRLSRSVALVGFLEEALRIVGARSVEVRLARAAALGDPVDELEATWS